VGNIIDIPLSEILVSDQQRAFGLAKRDSLPQFCLDCDVRFVCNGGCPKDRFIETPEGESSLNYLCEGYKSFFSHINEPMQFMARELSHHRPPANVMFYIHQKDRELQAAIMQAGRNDPCPCGSGLKYKKCHERIHRQ
jgi:uncharacterized protein